MKKHTLVRRYSTFLIKFEKRKVSHHPHLKNFREEHIFVIIINSWNQFGNMGFIIQNVLHENAEWCLHHEFSFSKPSHIELPLYLAIINMSFV